MATTTTAGNDVQVFPPPAFQPLLDEIAAQLVSRGATIAVAETSTGGLISAALLSVPGASKFFVGGTTVYTPTARKAWAGWDDQTAAHYLGPTPEIVSGLATSVRAQLGTTLAVGESGTTGPTVPPRAFHFVKGRTNLAVVSEEGVVTRTVDTGNEERGYNMVAFAEAALVLIRDVLTGQIEFERTVQRLPSEHL